MTGGAAGVHTSIRKRDALTGNIASRVAILAALILLSGCAQAPSLYGHPGVAAAAHEPWIPPARAITPSLPEQPKVAIPEDLLSSSRQWSLADIVDIALRSSSETRAAWAAARSAAAAYGSRRGDYLPDVNVGANVTRQRSTSTSAKPAEEQRTYASSADFSWLLFNFGGRHAAIEETRQALLAADWTHNAVIQNVVLQVEQAYYQYVTVKALLAAESASLDDAQANLNAAEDRHSAGLATIADVLQARTALSQVQLALAGLNGRIATTRGALATSMGLPANTPFDVELLPDELPVQQAVAEVDQYLEQAKRQRADLAAARAQALKAQAHVRTVKASGLPSLSATGSVSRVYRDNPDQFSDPYALSLQLRWPLFTGFSHLYDIQQSHADEDLARARLQGLEQSIVLEVWTSYYDFQTAGQRLTAADDLLRSATESHAVALARYQSGVGTILDLLAAQAALEGARAQMIQARSDWYVSLAQLAHDTGTLGPSTAAESPGNAVGSGKEVHDE